MAKKHSTEATLARLGKLTKTSLTDDDVWTMKSTKQPVTRLDYCQYLLSSQINYTFQGIFRAYRGVY